MLFDTIEEKIERKVLAIEEDLARRKERVRQTYAGQSDESRDKAQSDIEASREALTELVEAVRGSSACEALDSEIDEVIREVQDPHLKELLRRAGTFIYPGSEPRRTTISNDLKDCATSIRWRRNKQWHEVVLFPIHTRPASNPGGFNPARAFGEYPNLAMRGFALLCGSLVVCTVEEASRPNQK